MALFARTASYHHSLVVDEASQTSLSTMLKSRSMSAPSLAINTSFCLGSQHKQPTFSNVSKTATIHDPRLSEYQVRKGTFKFGKSDVVELQTGARNPSEKMLKRSMSTPSLAKRSSSCRDSWLRQSLSTTTATIHTGCGQFKACERECYSNIRKAIKMDQGTSDRALFLNKTMKAGHFASPNSSNSCQKEQKSTIRRPKSVPFYSTEWTFLKSQKIPDLIPRFLEP